MTKDYILRDWSSIVNTETNGFPDDACLLARTDSVKNVLFKRDSIMIRWAQSQLYDPTLKPCKPGRSIAHVNTQILDPSPPLRKCFTQTWGKGDKVAVVHGTAILIQMKVWYAQHNRFKLTRIPWMLNAQKAAGSFPRIEFVCAQVSF